jgi:hypothetical protein
MGGRLVRYLLVLGCTLLTAPQIVGAGCAEERTQCNDRASDSSDGCEDRCDRRFDVLDDHWDACIDQCRSARQQQEASCAKA